VKDYFSQKKDVLEDGGYLPVPYQVYRSLLPELVKKHGSKARDALTVLFYLHAYVNAKSGWAYPNFEDVVKDTGIHRNRIKKLIELLEEEGLVKTETFSYKGKPKRRYLPYFKRAKY